MKGQDKTTRSFVVGPITAYVEKKLVYSMISNKTGPFLRVREKTATKNYIYGMEGSPPRVRGKVGSALPFQHATGITPACAGKSHRLI